jgi:hypothetical protein
MTCKCDSIEILYSSTYGLMPLLTQPWLAKTAFQPQCIGPTKECHRFIRGLGPSPPIKPGATLTFLSRFLTHPTIDVGLNPTNHPSPSQCFVSLPLLFSIKKLQRPTRESNFNIKRITRDLSNYRCHCNICS